MQLFDKRANRVRTTRAAKFLSAIALLLIGTVCTASSAFATIVIPTAERQVLTTLYNVTNGARWTDATGWGGAAGTECKWKGIQCVQTGRCVILLTGGTRCPGHISQIDLSENNLMGEFQLVYLNGLPYLSSLDVSVNHLYGTIPDFSQTALTQFDADNNILGGGIPTLIASLQEFSAEHNQLTGSIPPLQGLPNLGIFVVADNRLTGQLPSLAGMPALGVFSVWGNQLSGTIPAFGTSAQLITVSLSRNQLTGSIPSLAGLVNLEGFEAESNQLTGSIPPLASLTHLESIRVANNQLTGQVPPPPSSGSMHAAWSTLCPNALSHTTNTAWDFATGSVPWYAGCM